MMLKATPAPSPFDHHKADVVLRSSDKEPIDFRVFKILLSLSSPFFHDIFTLPQPPPSMPGSPYADEVHPLTEDFDDYGMRSPNLRAPKIPVIQMSEDSETLRLFLSLCLPISVLPIPTKFTLLPQIQKVIEIANKFEMPNIQVYLRKELLAAHFLESQPLRVFAMAYRYGWDNEARVAARYTLRQPPPMSGAFVAELEYISAATFFRLQEYHRVCGEVASSRVSLQPALAEHDDCWTWVRCTRCASSSNTVTISLFGMYRAAQPDARKWWANWIKEVTKEVKERPWGETVRKWDLMQRAIEQAGSCPFCGPKARQDLEAFASELAVQIERDISSVDLDINFDDWSSVSPSTE